MISLLDSLFEVVINVLSASDKSETKIAIKSFLVSKISLIDSPMLPSSEAFKTSARKATLVSSLFSVMKVIFSCLLDLIVCFKISISDKSSFPSLLASCKLPWINWSSKFFWIIFSSILLDWINSSVASSNTLVSDSVASLSTISLSWSADNTCLGSKRVFRLPSEETLSEPTFPKLSLAKLTVDFPFNSLVILNLVPLTSKIKFSVTTFIEPLSIFAITPDSIIAPPFLIFKKNELTSTSDKINSSTIIEDDFCSNMDVLSLKSIVAVAFSFVKTSSSVKIESYKFNWICSPSLSVL